MGLVSRVVKALTKAESEVTRLEQAVVRWQTEAEAKRQELLELEASAGDRLLADTTGALAREMAVDAQELRFSIDGALAASQAAERQLRAARWELALAQAAEKRDQAAKLTAQADAHQAKVDELLRQLTELDGAEYRAYEPSLEESRAMMIQHGRASWVRPKADVMRDPVPGLLTEADALEQRVTRERQDLLERTSAVAGQAMIEFPDPRDTYTDTRVSLSVNEGRGSATFEVWVNGTREHTVTLPDEAGNRRFGTKVRVHAGGGRAEVRCNGQVIAEDTRPGQRVPSPSGGYIQLPA